MAEGIAESMGGHCEVEISHGYPYLENNPALTQSIRQAAEEYIGKENVVDIDLTLGVRRFCLLFTCYTCVILSPGHTQ